VETISEGKIKIRARHFQMTIIFEKKLQSECFTQSWKAYDDYDDFWIQKAHFRPKKCVFRDFWIQKAHFSYFSDL
jgi:hypothetical protein